jgi:tetratricopeptide (TPR) repeat protein
MYMQALGGYEKAWGAEHTSTLNTVNNLGNLYKDQGKIAEAEAMYLRALEGREKVLGHGHTSTLQTVQNLGVLYEKQDKSTQAEKMYLRALHGREKALGAEHTSTLNSVKTLASLYTAKGKTTEAETLWLRVIKTRWKVRGAWSEPMDIPLRRLLSIYRQHAYEGVATRSGQRLCLLSSFASLQCQPTAIWDKVVGLRDFLTNSPKPCLYSIGRILLGIGDEYNAIQAFQHDRAMLVKIRCNGCQRNMPAGETYYACISCDNKDFCHVCWTACQSDEIQTSSDAIAQCSGHGFYRILGENGVEVRCRADARQAAQEWMANLLVSKPVRVNEGQT